MGAMKPGDFLRELDGIAVAPAGPESALAAVIAVVRTSAGELHDDGAHAAVVAIVAMIDQFPADAIRVKIFDHRGGPGFDDPAGAAKGDPIHRREVLAV